MMVDHNINSLYTNSFDVPDAEEFFGNGFLSNNLSTNFFSKFAKNDVDKISD
jgi:hypothetical protein